MSAAPGERVFYRPRWPTGMCGYLEGLSFPEEILDLFGQRIIEIVRHSELPFGGTQESPFFLRFQGDELGHRFARLGDNDFFSEGDALEQAREVSLSLVNVDFHCYILAKSWTKSISGFNERLANLC